MATTELPDCVTRLAEARNAYHLLMAGTRAVKIAHGDREVEYTRISSRDLLAYVQRLEAECGGCNGAPSRRRPIMFGAGNNGGCH